MDKSHLKKMAMMGMAGGLLMISGSALNAEVHVAGGSDVNMARHGCNRGTCGARTRAQAQQNSCGTKSGLINTPQDPQAYYPGPSGNGCQASAPRGHSCSSFYQEPNNWGSRPNQDPQAYYQNDQRFNSMYADSATATATVGMTEGELLNQLNEQGRSIYQGLDAEGKALALKLANQTCKGKNDCKGLNSCKGDENTCAGSGGCRGKSPGPFKDKNVAVKVAAQKMAEKRVQMRSSSSNY